MDKVFASELQVAGGSQEAIENTEKFLLASAKLFSNYWSECSDRDVRVIDLASPDNLLAQMDGEIGGVDLRDAPESLEAILNACRFALSKSVRVAHPHCFNQLFAGPDPVGVAGEWMTAVVNTSMYTFEMAPVFLLIEGTLLSHMRRLVGWPEGAGDGIFCPGGSISNLFAMNVARFRRYPDVKKRGNWALPGPLAVFTSEDSHYSITKGVTVLGLGLDSVYKVRCDALGCMIPEHLEEQIAAARQDGRVPFFLNATAGTTVRGAYDPFERLAAIAREHTLWLHIDGAWGASALVSPRLRALRMQGVEHADSLSWCPHKMMGVPLQCSALLMRDPSLLLECHASAASYLFQRDKENAEHDTGDKTIQCGRRVDALKLWLMWRAHGHTGMAARIENAFDNAQYMAAQVQARASEGFTLLFAPQSVNVCFHYTPAVLRDAQLDPADHKAHLHLVAPFIKREMQRIGSTMCGFQPLGDHPNFFRMIVNSPAVSRADLDWFLDEVKRIGSTITHLDMLH